MCETYINEHNVNECKIPGYTLLHKFRESNKRGGGVAILMFYGIQFKGRDDISIFDKEGFELCFAEINSRKTIIGEIYRVPNTPLDSFRTKYKAITDKINLENKDAIIGMDQNLDFMNIFKHQVTEEFFEQTITVEFLPTILLPTWVNHSNKTLIDNIYYKGTNKIAYHSGVILSDISDHFPCLFNLEQSRLKTTKPKIIESRKLDDEKYFRLNHELLYKDWSQLEHLEVNDDHMNFHKTLLEAIVSPLKCSKCSTFENLQNCIT